MSKADKLKKKLAAGTISGRELRTLFGVVGARLVHGKGSHEVWVFQGRVNTFKLSQEPLLPYQIKNARRLINGEE